MKKMGLEKLLNFALIGVEYKNQGFFFFLGGENFEDEKKYIYISIFFLCV